MLERIHLEKRQVRGLDDTAGFACSTVATKVCVIPLIGSDRAFIIGFPLIGSDGAFTAGFASSTVATEVCVITLIGSDGAFIISLVVGTLFCVII